MSRKSRERRPKASERPTPVVAPKKSDAKKAKVREEFLASPADAASVIALNERCKS